MPSETFKNPLIFPSIQEMLLAILNAVIVISIPFVVFFIIYAGFLYVTARGNAEQISKASKALLFAVIGGVIIISSVAILRIIGSTVTSITP